jgi:hypothetical protein
MLDDFFKKILIEQSNKIKKDKLKIKELLDSILTNILDL